MSGYAYWPSNLGEVALAVELRSIVADETDATPRHGFGQRSMGAAVNPPGYRDARSRYRRTQYILDPAHAEHAPPSPEQARRSGDVEQGLQSPRKLPAAGAKDTRRDTMSRLPGCWSSSGHSRATRGTLMLAHARVRRHAAVELHSTTQGSWRGGVAPGPSPSTELPLLERLASAILESGLT
ncbi:hypothetical protein Micbo1qcDRAFT_171130 [Microdochium bolleyi]|uniref:Uncharacterized protein n=1 Tax=Microdochium bolleyi TaxID=196109 RepID=A0A136JJZ1_9PEZI|nr:hypothetical protein Micbo1qcDRAFT_171130 [Microdochium bolleyi]